MSSRSFTSADVNKCSWSVLSLPGIAGAEEYFFAEFLTFQTACLQAYYPPIFMLAVAGGYHG